MIPPPVLTLLGYWASAEDSRWPRPESFIDDAWRDSQRLQVIRHLKRGVVIARFAGVSWCRMGCTESLGACELTDGVFVWPEGLSHYLEKHSVRPPEVFVRYCLAYHLGPEQQAAIDWFLDPAPEEKPVDVSWWMSQPNGLSPSGS